MALTNLLTNGDFSTGDTTGWTLTNATGSVTDGVLTLTSTVASISGRAIQAFTTAAGSKYKVRGYLAPGTGPARIAVQDGGDFSFITPEKIISSAFEVFDIEFTAKSSSSRVFLRVESATLGATANFGALIAYRKGEHNLKNIFTSGRRAIEGSEFLYTVPSGGVGQAVGTGYNQVPLNTVLENDYGMLLFNNGLIRVPEGYYKVRAGISQTKGGLLQFEIQKASSMRRRSVSAVSSSTASPDATWYTEGIVYSDGTEYWRMVLYSGAGRGTWARAASTGDNEVYAFLRFERFDI